MNLVANTSTRRVHRFHQIIFAMNIGFAVAYALFAYDASWHLPIHASRPEQGGLEAFSHILYNIAPLTAGAHTKAELLRSFIREAFFVVVMLAAAAFSYGAVCLSSRWWNRESTFTVSSGLTAIGAVPFFWLYVVHATWGDPFTFFNTYGRISILELLLFASLMYLMRSRPPWIGAVLATFHFGSWVFAVYERDFGNYIAPVIVSLPLSLVFPLSVSVWLRYVHVLQLRPEESRSS